MNQTKDRDVLLKNIALVDVNDAKAVKWLLGLIRQHLETEQELNNKIHHLLFGDYER